MADTANLKQFVLPGLNPDLNALLPWNTFMRIMGIDPEQFTNKELTVGQIKDLRMLLNKFRQIKSIDVLGTVGIATLYREILQLERNPEINIMFRMHREWRKMSYGVEYNPEQFKRSLKSLRSQLHDEVQDTIQEAVATADYNTSVSMLNSFITSKYQFPDLPDSLTFELVPDLMNEMNNLLLDEDSLDKSQIRLARQIRFALASIIKQTYSPAFIEAILQEVNQKPAPEEP
jgi:hypothetical protein